MLHLALVQNLLVRDRRRTPPGQAELPAARQPLPGRGAPGAAAVRRAGAAPLHVPRAARGHGAARRRGAGRRQPGGAPGAGRRHRPARPGLRHGRAPVPVDRGGHRPPGRQVRRRLAVRRPAPGAGDRAALPLARAGRGDRRGLRAARDRRDPGAGRRAAGAVAECALRPVRRHPGRVRAAPGGQPGLRPRPAGHRGQRPAERARSAAARWSPTRRAARVMDLFNVCYEILLLAFERFFAHTEETDAQLDGAGRRDRRR